ncbi:MAG: hypothetical protein F2754_14085 [Actinobacteria bacterium]|uniref:Unannotated protein n=1 Tax=freshwater metagenome TaxID=449393 RepID=A0A6J7FI96_9ZZZZ|nr:hypothetical protein [Actinomycetota bacterium]MSX88508.1 hypothetical protein [Actinomycetota bacterium]MSY71156.1 hypothetical protein [Actinomycetota bacterium]
MDLSKMRTPDWILGGCALALVIDLLFFPWHKIDINFGPLGSASQSRSGIQSPNSFWGVLALLLVLAILAVVIIRRLTTVKLPDLPISWADALFYGSIATLVLLLIKLVAETDFLGFGAYLGILLAGGLVYGGFATKQVDGSSASSAPPTAF